MRKFVFFIFFLITFELLVSCYKNGNDDITLRLAQLDSIIDEQPQVVSDSLLQLKPQHFSSANRAYYGLLKTIADDKTYKSYTSDSLINSVVDYYTEHNQEDQNLIRALIYQGITRIRMRISDTTVYVPLKEAEKLLSRVKNPDASTGYMLYYYLGNVNYRNGNYSVAEKYYKETLKFAKSENIKRHIFDAYAEIFWNKMTQEDYENGKLYLDTITSFKNSSPDIDYQILNMQSTYYSLRGNYPEALQNDKEMLRLLPVMKEKIDTYRTFYSISSTYGNANKLDSAMYYGLQAVNHITDSTNNLNYLLYKNIADIAFRQNDYKTADEYRNKSFDVYKQGVNDRINKNILELEKRYDLTEAENKTLKSEARSRILAIFLLLILIFFEILGVIYYKRRKINILKIYKLKAQKELAETQTLLLQSKTEVQQRMVALYSSFLKQYADQQQQLKLFEMKIRGSKNSKMADEYKEILKTGEEEFNIISKQLINKETVEDILNIHTGLELLTETDRLLLVMLALRTDNSLIAALLNTTLVNLKSKKSYLKKKIIEHASYFDNFEQIIQLF